MIWNSLPDQTLMDQATSGMLGTAEGIRTAATRMLSRPPDVNRSVRLPRSTCGWIGS